MTFEYDREFLLLRLTRASIVDEQLVEIKMYIYIEIMLKYVLCLVFSKLE